MLKKSLFLGSIVLLILALFALNGCDNGDGGTPEKTPEKEEPAQGDLGGITIPVPTHKAPAPSSIKGANATAAINWGVTGGTFRYNDGAAAKASVKIKANPDYVFSQTLNETDILEVFGRITGDIDDDYALSEDYTELTFSFSYIVAQAVLDLSSLKDIKLIAGSTALPPFIDGSMVENLDLEPENAPATEYVSAAAPETALATLPAAGTGFKVKVKATAAYGYKWPDNFNYKELYENAAKVTPSVAGNVLSLVLEYKSGLQVINTLPAAGAAGGFVPLFANAPLGGAQIPVKLRFITDNQYFTLEDEGNLQWSGLSESDKIAVASKSVSTPVKLIPKAGYTFSGTGLTASATTIAGIAAAFNANTSIKFNHKVEEIKADHELEFILTYPVAAVQIQKDDMSKDLLAGALASFYQPRIGQKAVTDLKLPSSAQFTAEPILWTDASGNEKLDAYADQEIHGSITLTAKPGYSFANVVVTDFTSTLLAAFTKATDMAKAPDVKIIGTPDDTLTFVVIYARTDLNKAISTAGNTVIADGDALNSGGGLEEIFASISGNTVTIPKGTSTINLAKPPVIPQGKTLELAEGASVTTTEPLAADGNITLGKGSSLATTGS
ncbi:MAG: hypothetical protein LBP42_05030, partial [Treponema sp.]|nr:hypothetical protein [Treponema sp.]